MKYKVIEDIVPRTIMDSHMLISVGERALTHNEIVELSETGMFLWKKLSEPRTEDELVVALLQEYDVDEATAKADIHVFMDKLLKAGLMVQIADSGNE